MKRDIYAEVSARIVAELAGGVSLHLEGVQAEDEAAQAQRYEEREEGEAIGEAWRRCGRPLC